MIKRGVFYLIILVAILGAAAFFWKGSQPTVLEQQEDTSKVVNRTPSGIPAPIVVYKTKGDYRDFVSVMLSLDGSTILAYPGPRDAALERPIALGEGYLIGQMPGAGHPDGAFLDIHIGDYSKMPEEYLLSIDLQNHLLDRNPFLEIYNCSNATNQTAMVNDINGWIAIGELGNKCGRVL